MNIREVLSSKGNHIETVRPYQRVNQVVQLLDERNISSVIVINPAGDPVGIVTDRMVIRTVARQGARALELSVSDVMETPVPVCSPDDTLQHALHMMTDRRVRHLLVMFEHKAIGLVSIGDIVKFRLRDSELEGRVLRELAYAHKALA